MHEDPDNRSVWRRSSRCADEACVEVAAGHEWVYLRGGTAPETATLRISRPEWEAFRDGMKLGEFDSV